MSTANDDPFQQSQFIPGIHNIPRFGHSNHISKLASFQRAQQEDYVRGILGFAFFAFITLYAWTVLIIGCKFVLESTNWAAGGSLMNVSRLRKQKIPRVQRRRRIVRSWRIQNVFLVASILIPIATMLLTRNGLRPLINSLDEVESISDEVEAVAYKGIAIAQSLQQARESLKMNFTDINLPDLCSRNTTQQGNTSSNALVMPIDTLTQYIHVGMSEVKGFIDQYADEATTGLHRVAAVTASIDSSIEWIFRNDWMLKFFLLTINVVNSFFLMGVFLSKQDLVFPSYQRFLSYSLIPIFILLLICSMTVSCVFGMSTMVNADFCYDNTRVDGTMHDIIVNSGIDKSDLSYQAFMHYMGGCIGDHPLDFIHSLDSVIKHTMNAITLLEGTFDSTTPTQLKEHCTEDVQTLISAIPQLTAIMGEVQRQVRAIIELTGCHQINPVLRRILYGVTCSDTVDALAWLFLGMWCITLVGFIMLTVRAALHNSVVRAPRRKRKGEREKEFDEYKQYMAEYYKDTDDWQLDALALAKKELNEFPDTIPHIPTCETEEDMSVSPHNDDEAEGTDIAYFASPQKKSDGNSSESSYESDYSSDSDDQRSTMSFSVLVGKMFHLRRNLDESQSHLPGMSMLTHDTPTSSRATPRRPFGTPKRPLGILELQTPRRRIARQHVPSPILPLPSSPSSPRLLPPMGSPFGSNDGSSSDGSVYTTSPPLAGSTTPMAPSKPRRKIYRTKGGKKES